MVKVLLVDDEQDILDMFRDSLEARGHQVAIARNATEALDKALDTAFDVAVIDYVLPGKRGLDLLYELRQKHPFMRAIIISAQIDHDILNAKELEKELQEQLEVDLYLAKPLSTRVLNEAVRLLSKPVSGKKVDWKRLAARALSARKIKSRDVERLDRKLTKKRKKP